MNTNVAIKAPGLRIYRITLARWIGYFVLIDLMLLPYLQTIVCPYSLPILVVILVINNTRTKNDYYLKLYLLIAFAVLSSFALSIFRPSCVAEYEIENLKRVIQFLSSFLYFFYFRWLSRRTELNIFPILVVFCLWFAFLLLQFVNDPLSTNALIRDIYGRLVTGEKVVSGHLRFAYLFNDPNTAVYFFLMVLAVIIMITKSDLALLLILGFGFIIVFCIQSMGGLLAFGFMVLTRFYPPNIIFRYFFSIKKVILSCILILIVGLLIHYFQNIALDYKVVDFAFNRFEHSTSNIVVGDVSRFEVWLYGVRNLLAMPMGRGYTLLIDGSVYRPHSDFLGLLYRYGFLALIPAIIFFFSKYKRFAPLLAPAFVAFSVNSLIDEQKLLGLFLSLLAIFIGTQERCSILMPCSSTRRNRKF